MSKTERIEIRVTKKHKALLENKAESHDICLSDYMLFCGLNAEIKCTIGADTFQSEINILEIKLKDGIINKYQFSEMIDVLITKEKKRLETTV